MVRNVGEDDGDIQVSDLLQERNLNETQGAAGEADNDLLLKRQKEKSKEDKRKSLCAFREIIRDWVYPWVKYLDHTGSLEPTQHCLPFKWYLMGVAPKNGTEAKEAAERWRKYAPRNLGPVVRDKRQTSVKALKKAWMKGE